MPEGAYIGLQRLLVEFAGDEATSGASALSDVLKRLEADPRPSFIIDQEIGNALFGANPKRVARCYTSKIDDALTLLPDGWGFKIERRMASDLPICLVEVWEYDDKHKRYQGASNKEFPSVALCIAILKAMVRMEEGK